MRKAVKRHTAVDKAFCAADKVVTSDHECEFRAYQLELEKKIEESRGYREELEESRNKYAFLYDFAPVGYFTFDQDGTILSSNLTGERLLGRERAELVGQHFTSFVADEDQFLFENYLARVFSSHTKETCRIGLAQQGKLSSFVRIEAMVTETGDECLAVLLDITEKKRAELALSESEYNLAKAQSMTHVGSWSFDPLTSEINASEELLRIMHLSRAEATHQTFASVVHPDDYEMVMEHLRLGTLQGNSYEIEHRLQFEDGAIRWVYTIVEPQLNSFGNVIKLYGTTQDITERKRAEVELRNKSNELQAIFDSISDGIIVYDHDGRVQHHNQIIPELFAEEILPGKNCQSIFHPHEATLARECPVERSICGERVETSMVYARNNRRTLYLDITATPIKDALSDKHRALVFIRDISEKRLQEMHLIQAEKMSSIGVLATGIAHEINNPLTSVAGCAEALLRRFRDDPALRDDVRLDIFPHYLNVIERESYRCKGIIDRLLSFGRKSDGFSINVDINELLLEIVELIKHQSAYRLVQVVTTLEEKLPAVNGDPSALRQVFMNLLINAHQAITGKGLVEISTATLDNDAITIGVQDTGCGIAKEIIDRIWDPFFTTKEVGKGVGLGLALTYNIVKRHGGKMEVTSSEGKGSLFKVILPVSRR
jgi:PAS domain S-box-containing protein